MERNKDVPQTRAARRGRGAKRELRRATPILKTKKTGEKEILQISPCQTRTGRREALEKKKKGE